MKHRKIRTVRQEGRKSFSFHFTVVRIIFSPTLFYGRDSLSFMERQTWGQSNKIQLVKMILKLFFLSVSSSFIIKNTKIVFKNPTVKKTVSLPRMAMADDKSTQVVVGSHKANCLARQAIYWKQINPFGIIHHQLPIMTFLALISSLNYQN